MPEPTTIADAITAAQGRVADAYTAISNKGGTLPATQNLANMPTAINSIPSGSTGYTEVPSYQVSNGVVSRRSGSLTGNEFSSVTSIGAYGLCYAFYRCNSLRGTINLSSLTTVGNYGLSHAFGFCSVLAGVNLSSLTTIGNYGLDSAFISSHINSVDLSSVTTIGNYGLSNAFAYITFFGSVNLSSVTTIGNYGLSNAFNGTSMTRNLYFNSLTTTSFGSYTTQFSDMLSNTGWNKQTLHFPSNLETVIQGLDGYPNFGGLSRYVVLAFDLEPTE